MNLQQFDDAISKLQKMIGEVLPALNPKRGGDSTIIEVKSDIIVFKRKNSEKRIRISLMRSTYLSIPLDCKELDKIFKKEMCKKTFFLQFLIRFNLATVMGKGVSGSPFSVK